MFNRRILLLGLAVIAAITLVAWGVMQGTTPGQARHLLAQSRSLAAHGHEPEAIAKLRLLIERFPTGAVTDDALYLLGQLAEREGDLVAAQQSYARILQDFPMSDLAGQAQEALGDVNLRLIYSPTVTPQDTLYVVQPGDTLAGIAKRFHTTVELLKRSNHLASDTLHPAMRLKIVRGDFNILVDKSHNILLLKRGEEIVKQYTVATGSENSTPVGTFTVINRLVDPPWYTDHGVIPAGDPRNILGTRWLGFDKPGYGIHGTTDPSSVGKQVTAGCVRLRNADVEELYPLIPEGTRVLIIN